MMRSLTVRGAAGDNQAPYYDAPAIKVWLMLGLSGSKEPLSFDCRLFWRNLLLSGHTHPGYEF
jgi:hypothetical protein